MNDISSSCAIELMTIGASMSDIPLLREKAEHLSFMAKDLPFDTDAAVANLAKSPDSFREMYVMRRLVAEKDDPKYRMVGNPDPNIVNHSGAFNRILADLSETTAEGINPYLGSATVNQTAIFLLRWTLIISRSFGGELAPHLYEPVAKAVSNVVYDEKAAYRAEFLEKDEDAVKTLNYLKNHASPLIGVVGNRLSRLRAELPESYALIREEFDRALPLFQSREADSGENYIARGEMFQRFRESGLRTSYAIGIREHGAELYARRLKSCQEQCDGFFMNPKKSGKIAARIAAGPAAMPDFRMLAAYVAKDDPMPYNVPKHISTSQKLAALAAHISQNDGDPAEICAKAAERIAEDRFLSCVGSSDIDPCASAFSMIAREIASAGRWGDDREAREFAESLAKGGRDRTGDFLK